MSAGVLWDGDVLTVESDVAESTTADRLIGQPLERLDATIPSSTTPASSPPSRLAGTHPDGHGRARAYDALAGPPTRACGPCQRHR